MSHCYKPSCSGVCMILSGAEMKNDDNSDCSILGHLSLTCPKHFIETRTE
ncbi:hypothetical protein LEMLEM_LOCUS3334 [Lemmus lemmus]